MSCPFCDLEETSIIFRTEGFVALWDKHPVAEGHALIVTERHVRDIFELDGDERAGLLDFVERLRDYLSERFRPDGFNIGFNVGPAAGQSLEHAHIHVIPRRRGDTPDPRGGIRGAIPDKMNY